MSNCNESDQQSQRQINVKERVVKQLSYCVSLLERQETSDPKTMRTLIAQQKPLVRFGARIGQCVPKPFNVYSTKCFGRFFFREFEFASGCDSVCDNITHVPTPPAPVALSCEHHLASEDPEHDRFTLEACPGPGYWGVKPCSPPPDDYHP